MNIKRIFGSLLTLLGIAGLIYGAVIIVNGHGNDRDLMGMAVYGLLGLAFFIAGISLVRTTKDES